MTQSSALRILVVDDDREELANAADALAGHDLTLATSFLEAQKKLDDSRRPSGVRFDVLLTDPLLLLEEADLRHLNTCIPASRVAPKMARGIGLVFLAARSGVRFAGMVADHYSTHHPELEMLANAANIGGDQHVFRIDQTLVGYFDAAMRHFDRGLHQEALNKDRLNIEKGINGQGRKPCLECLWGKRLDVRDCLACCGKGLVDVKCWALALSLILSSGNH